MSRRWLLSLLCLSVLFLSMVQLTRARGELRVNEALTRILLQKEPAEVILAVENSSGQIVNARVEVELLNPANRAISQISGVRAVGIGSQLLKLSLPVSLSSLKERDRRELLWHRLRYRLSEDTAPAVTLTEGIVSLSEIAPDLFEIRVATSEVVREGGRYHARVQAYHPTTRQPAADVQIDGEITLEDDDDKNVKLHASKITDDKGSAALDFVLPQRFPQYPHSTRPAGGEIRIIGRRGGIVAEAVGNVVVDQFARILINSDKPLYQPGQVMHVRALVFTPSRRALANQNILVRICDPEETTLFRSVVKSSRFGVANTDWLIPENARLGDYRIWVGVDGEEESAQVPYDVRVSRYDLPNFSVSVQPDREYYLPVQNAEVKVRADYLFGKPVVRGHVRVVREIEREWNYREQKWDIENGDQSEGETDPSGVFTAHINLADDYEDLSDSYYQPYKDVTYAAYFTDPTTNRTEHQRFELRVTQKAIHVYMNYSPNYNRRLPLSFYVSTFYANGSPARCKLDLTLTDAGSSSEDQAENATRKLLTTLRTNRYGLAKISGARLPREFENEREINLVVSAVDSRGRTGSKTQELSLVDDETVLVETDKSLYRTGEPIVALITSSSPNQTAVVDIARDSSVIRSERVQLHHGRGSVTFLYKPEFKGKLTIAAYHNFPESQTRVGTRTILYPSNPDLKVNVRTSHASYRPGEDAQVNLSVRAPEGRSSESALGVVVMDKAVEERFRTDQESGRRPYTFNDAMQRFLDLDQVIAGVTLRDLQRLDMARNVSPDMDLVAEVMLNQSREYSPDVHNSDQYETSQLNVFGDSIRKQLEPLRNALTTHYAREADYPKDEAGLRRLLPAFKISPETLRDPWGTPYRAVFLIDQQSDVLTLVSAGADKRFETGDDFTVERAGWPYFRRVGEVIDKAVRRHHQTTGGFIRDFATLRGELAKDSLDLNSLRDHWGHPYRFEFEVNQTNYLIKVSSGGPDTQFSPDNRYVNDDFVIWRSVIDYFTERRTQIQTALTQYLKSTKTFPQTDPDLRAALRNAGESLEILRDPWGRSYYPTFRTQSTYMDRARIENRTKFGESVTQQITLTPMKQDAAFITLRSMGADGKAGTADDFDVAAFSEVISEQPRVESQPQAVPSKLVLSLTSGAIAGLVTDPNGASITEATITATGSNGGQRYSSSSNAEGSYSFADLPPGIYEIRFEARGFTALVLTNVLVSAFNLTHLNATLQVGSVMETVMVTEGGSGVENNFTMMSSVSASRSYSRGNINLITKSGRSQDIATPRLREYFPETLVWQPSIETDKQGRAKISFKLADNITTWKVAVIGSTEDGWIGIAETEIKAFQPFFVEHDPPRVLTDGDEISLPVVVRNYLERTQNVDLEIKPESWFALLGPARKRTAVVAGDATRETFDLRAIAAVNDGKQRITATGGEVSDAIEKPVTVHPDGKEMSVTAGDILSSSAELQLDLPETMIPNSRRAELKIYPNLMAHVVESVEAIMARPYGCGEQTISSTYPSLLLLRHYKQSGDDFPLRARAQRYLEDGYSRLLNYRDESGGFTYWGHGEPDVALTAYGLRFLTDAADLIAVDGQIIKEAREWLIKQQRSDGRWLAHESPVLTAYVTRILTMTEKSNSETPPETSAALKRALDYLDQQAREINEPYLLASYALAAIDAQDTTRAKFPIDKLRLLAHAEGNTSYWSLETTTPFHGWGVAGQVETTALAVHALAKYCESRTANCEPYMELSQRGLLFLLKQKDSYGVWHSTQTTINVLDAMLTLFSTKTVSSTQSPTEIVVNGRLVQTFQMPAARRLVNPITFNISQFLNSGKNRIEIKRATGSPFASVQALVNYYVPWSDSGTTGSSDLRLLAKFDKTEGRINDKITCHVEVERVRGYGMMLAEIGLPPGADVDRSSLETAMKNSAWAISQYDVLPDRVVVYLSPARGVKFDFQFRPRFGLNAQTAPSTIYDYYNPESRATVPPVRFRVK
ncbi:MAG TPA: alpha-2-macroglobulin family protein [Pyrinomonadaceae bacterium]|nr:alpha-2-macroglobulin family protein [Pyrinomonadaceae bacterium]